MDLGNKKKEARLNFRKKRKKSILLTEKHFLLQVEKLLKNLSHTNCNRNFIGIYWPLKDEVDLRSLKKLSKLTLALPASNERGEISYHKWTNSILKKDAYGLTSPLITLSSGTKMGKTEKGAVWVNDNMFSYYDSILIYTFFYLPPKNANV